jgi:hypothetical protein
MSQWDVNTPWSNNVKGVSSNGGRVRSRIISPFCGNKSVRSRWPPSKGNSMRPSAHVARIQDAKVPASPPAAQDQAASLARGSG